jgi:hypothetical protein
VWWVADKAALEQVFLLSSYHQCFLVITFHSLSADAMLTSKLTESLNKTLLFLPNVRARADYLKTPATS